MHPEGPATGQLHQGFGGCPRSQSRSHAALHLSGAARPAITSFPESKNDPTAALQTQNCTVSSYCCPPNTKLHRFVILLPSKHKTAPFRHTAALQTQNCTVSSYCCPPNTKQHRFVILLPSKHKTAPFRHTAALQTQNCTVSSYCCPPNTKLHLTSYCCPPNTKLHRFVTLLPSKHKTSPFRHTAALQTQNCTISSYCCPPNTKLRRFVILLAVKHKTAPFRHTAALQTQNCTVSSYCCPPHTKLTPQCPVPSLYSLQPAVTSHHPIFFSSQRLSCFHLTFTTSTSGHFLVTLRVVIFSPRPCPPNILIAMHCLLQLPLPHTFICLPC